MQQNDWTDELKSVSFQDDPFLLLMTSYGSTWWGRAATDTLVVAAVKRTHGNAWSAYMEDPHWGPERVVDYGNKMPEDAARRLFPGEPWLSLTYVF